MLGVRSRPFSPFRRSSLVESRHDLQWLATRCAHRAEGSQLGQRCEVALDEVSDAHRPGVPKALCEVRIEDAQLAFHPGRCNHIDCRRLPSGPGKKAGDVRLGFVDCKTRGNSIVACPEVGFLFRGHRATRKRNGKGQEGQAQALDLLQYEGASYYQMVRRPFIPKGGAGLAQAPAFPYIAIMTIVTYIPQEAAEAEARGCACYGSDCPCSRQSRPQEEECTEDNRRVTA
jgi:hypothetical protein